MFQENDVNKNYYGSTKEVTQDCVSYRNLCVLPVLFVAISECGLLYWHSTELVVDTVEDSWEGKDENAWGRGLDLTVM